MILDLEVTSLPNAIEVKQSDGSKWTFYDLARSWLLGVHKKTIFL